MDLSKQSTSAREALRKIREEARHTKSLDVLREQFDHLLAVRRQEWEDFDLQVMMADIHSEIIERARYLRGDSPAPFVTPDDSPELFQRKTPEKPLALPPAPAAPQNPPQTSTDVAVIPPEVPRVDPKSWQTILGLTAFLVALALIGFFYLVQAARKLNFGDENTPETVQPVQPAKPASTSAAAVPKAPVVAPVPLKPTLRLYTDLVPGTVTVDDQAPRDLVDGELVLDNPAPGRHSIKVAGRSGVAAFQFDVAGHNAPKVVGVPNASNALAVLVSQQDGRGELVTNAASSTVFLDGKPAGGAGPAILELTGLGTADHDLQIVHDRDRQRFVMTYTPNPVLTVYVKSDPNTGILQVLTGEDGVDVYIENTLFRRRTEHGEVRMSVREGKYAVRVHKDGFIDPPQVRIEVKKGELTPVKFQLVRQGNFASLQIKGAMPGTIAYIDKDLVAIVGADGSAKVGNIKPGEHTVELRHDQSVPKKLPHAFRAGELLTLFGNDVALEKTPVESKPAPPANVPAPGVSSVPAGQPANQISSESTPTEGSHLPKGGGFVTYDVPRSPGHYSFRTQGHVGGVFKKGKLQWYAGFQDNQNYVLFSLDGKHAEVREMRHGRNIQVNRIPFELDSESWVQVDLAVKSGAISARIKTGAEAWQDMGTVASTGRDFTQDKVGFYVPPNQDEVAVKNFKFSR